MKLLNSFSVDELKEFKCGQKILTNILRIFNKICRENNLKYWCVGGTLIGAVRHNGWIPHDADIDVAMLESDYIKFQKIVQQNLPNDCWFQNKFTDKNYKSEIGKIRYLYAYYSDEKDQHWHNGIQLDIFVNKNVNNTLIPKVCNNDSQPNEYNTIFPLKELVFEGIHVYVPNKLQQYCKNAWGGYPPPLLPERYHYPHEGRISFKIPQWMKNKYPHLYLKNNIITFGTFDVCHIGHTRILKRIASMKSSNGKLIVGVSSDSLSFEKKKRKPIFNENDRLEIVSNIKGVDEVFIEESLELKREYIIKYNASIFAIGNDWYGKFDELNDICKVIYLPRTEKISTSSIVENIQQQILD